MVGSRKVELIAAVIGIALAGVPITAFSLWLDRFIEQRGRQEVTEVAARSLAIADYRVGQVIGSLAALAERGVDGCDPDDLHALRQASFSTAPVKELSVVDSSGRTICADLAVPPAIRNVVSTHPITKDGDLLIDVVHLGDPAETMLRIRSTGDGNALAALVPAELFFPPSALNAGGSISWARAIATRDGQPIIDNGTTPQGLQGEADRFVATVPSERYNLAVTAAQSRGRVAARYGHLSAIGIVIAGLIGLVALRLAVVSFKIMFPMKRRTGAEREIELAMRAGEFVPYFQPIIDVASGKMLGGEVLIRRRKPDGSLVLPGEFIPLLESSGLIVDVTRTMMRRVLDEIGNAYGKRPHLRVAFNLSAAHFANEAIVRDVSDIFQDSAIRLDQVILEITERQPLDNLTETRRIIAALQGLGVVVAIDDVGIGHGGLSYLLKLGVDLIKIDKLFVDSIGTDPNSTAIVESLIDLARNMHMDIIAEGVESFEQVVLLRNLGIRAAQGYVFAPPLPASSFLHLLESLDPLPETEQDAPADGRNAA